MLDAGPMPRSVSFRASPEPQPDVIDEPALAIHRPYPKYRRISESAEVPTGAARSGRAGPEEAAGRGGPAGEAVPIRHATTRTATSARGIAAPVLVGEYVDQTEPRSRDRSPQWPIREGLAILDATQLQSPRPRHPASQPDHQPGRRARLRPRSSSRNGRRCPATGSWNYTSRRSRRRLSRGSHRGTPRSCGRRRLGVAALGWSEEGGSRGWSPITES